MSKLKVTTIANVADSESTDVTNVINGSAKAWVNFDGTFGTSPFTVANGGIRAAFNVSSVTDNSTGNYTVNFTTAMPDANYSLVGSAYNRAVASDTTQTASSARVRLVDTTSVLSDSDQISVAVFS